jgi:hypothetical protein
MTDQSRRDFLKSLYGLWLLGHMPLSFGATKVEGGSAELITQLVGPGDKHALIFFDLKKHTARTLELPYQIHGVLPIRDGKKNKIKNQSGNP